MHVIISDLAGADLEAIGDFIADDNPARAESFTSELLTACQGLADHPQRFSILERYSHLGYRRRPFGSYSIIYSVNDNDIVIVRIASSWIDLDAALDA